MYYRVSSKEQVDGQSLDVQKEQCEAWAEKYGYTIIEKFGGSYESAKSDERKEFNRMIKYVKQHKGKIQVLIVYNTSRFSRTGSTAVLEELESFGLSVFSATENYDPRTLHGRSEQRLRLWLALQNNDDKIAVIRANNKKALEKGRWICHPPRGYEVKTNPKVQTITINETGRLLRQAFLMKANENLTNEEVRLRMNALGLKICNQKWSEIFRNPFYCGYFSHKVLEGELIKGPHEPLVSEEVFLKVNNLLKRHHGSYDIKVDKEYAPLVGVLRCPVCGRRLTSSLSTKMRNKYSRKIGYYSCGHKGCKCNEAVKKAHPVFEELIRNYEIKDEYVELLAYQLKKTYRAFNRSKEEAQVTLKSRLGQTRREIDEVQLKYAVNNDPKKEVIYEKALKHLEQELIQIEEEMFRYENNTLNLENYLELGLQLRVNLSELWQKCTLGDKKRLQHLLFPQGAYYRKEERQIEPIETNSFFRVNIRLSDDFKDEENALVFENPPKATFVLGAGIEPAQPARAKGF